MTKRKNKSTIIFTGISGIVLLLAASIYAVFLSPNITLQGEDETAFLPVYPQSTAQDIALYLQQNTLLRSTTTWLLASKILRAEKNGWLHSGRYRLEGNMSNLALLRLLHSGRQTPVQVSFNNVRTREALAGRLSAQLMADSLTLIRLLTDSVFLVQYGVTPQTAVALFLPDTYEIYWNTDAKEIFDRIFCEYSRFWNEERRAKAAAIPLTPLQVSTLASIVEEESNAKSERATIAGLYINRLRQKMKLQADPTVKFALGNFALRRIRVSHIFEAKNSPYNTYLRTGLPPGPIRIPSKNAIDAVLNYAQHNYIYMCAKESFDGTHNFAVTYAEHLQNAKKYQKALNERNIH